MNNKANLHDLENAVRQLDEEHNPVLFHNTMYEILMAMDFDPGMSYLFCPVDDAPSGLVGKMAELLGITLPAKPLPIHLQTTFYWPHDAVTVVTRYEDGVPAGDSHNQIGFIKSSTFFGLQKDIDFPCMTINTSNAKELSQYLEKIFAYGAIAHIDDEFFLSPSHVLEAAKNYQKIIQEFPMPDNPHFN